MSKRRLHTNVAVAVAHLIREISSMTTAEAESLHGIHIDDDGSVVDQMSYHTFPTLTDWATFVIEQENAEYYAESSSIIPGKYNDDE